MIDRREAIALGAGAVATMLPGMAAADGMRKPLPRGLDPLAEAVDDCVARGQDCMQHCLQLLSRGKTQMAECAQAVHEMLAVCGAMQTLTRANSQHLKAMAKVCQAACETCHNACVKHAKHHRECKACGEACEVTLKALKVVLA